MSNSILMSARRAAGFGAVAVLSLTAACASVSPAPPLRAAETAPAGPDSDAASTFGLYLAGETALDQGESREAAFYLGRASARAPDAGFIKERAFAAALVSGEVDRAAALAPRAPEAPAGAVTAPLQSGPASAAPPASKPAAVDANEAAAYSLGLLAQATVALADNQGRQAYALLSSAPAGDHSAAILLVKPWAAAAAGNWAAATAPIVLQGDRALSAFGELGRALLLERAGRQVQAEASFTQEATRGGVFALAYGGFLERRGREADALALYGKALAKDPTDPAFLIAKARASAGRPAPAQPTIKQGAAQALVGPAAILLSAKQGEAGLAYLRLALRLDPKLDEAWVLVGDAMDSAGDPAAARAAYDRVPLGSPEYSTAQDRLALNLQNSGDKAGALKLAQATANVVPHDPQAMLVLADILREDERYGEAVAVLDQLISEIGGGDAAANWRLYYLRGASQERAGHWASAQVDLQRALQLKPDDPEVLNYLGFAWADRGEHLNQALDLLQKATALDPQDGAIIDSLGWVHYRLGDYAQAVRELELAISLDAADPEVNDHLGDAYWRTGRRVEAQYQWRRVLSLDPDMAIRASASAKLTNGLKTGAPASREP